MNAGLLFAVGTALNWLGWILAIRALVATFQTVTGQGQRMTGALVAAVAAAVSLIVGETLVRSVGSKQTLSSQLHLPLVWFAMPAAMWLSVASVFMVILRLVQVAMSIEGKERSARAKSAGVWVILVALGYWLYRRDEANKIEIFRGGIVFSPETLVILALLLVAGLFAMVISAKSTTARGFRHPICVFADLELQRRPRYVFANWHRLGAVSAGYQAVF